MEIKDGKQAIAANDRSIWRKWLEKNCAIETSVWLILYHKNSGVQSVNLIEATEEALCYGWIDSLCKSRDHQSYYLTFSRRKPKKSNWSLKNIERAEMLIKEGKMTEHGLKMIDIAKESGQWTKL